MTSKDRDSETFRVEDRRRFSPGSGERREGGAPPEKSIPPKPSGVTSSNEASSSSLPEVTFSGFVLGLSAQVLMFLGEAPDPEGGEPIKDLSAARQLIDILGILKDKTVGNLESDEERLLEHILYDLRTKFIEKSKQK